MNAHALFHAGMLLAAPMAASPPEAYAQSATPDAKLGKVEVTGTNIRRTDAETALPVQVITRQDIDRGGMVTAQDVLERVSANQSYGGWNDNLGVGSSLAGFTGASLRGLGTERTLVLLNGRRLAPYALSGGQSVDLSGIPVSAIERVEVLKDGASAIYGTDAIGGVINFILRKDYRGIEAGGTYQGVQHGGGELWRASVTGGWGDLARDGVNAFLTVDHVRQQPQLATERAFSRTSYLPEVGLIGTSNFSFPANIVQRPVQGQGFGASPPRNPSLPVTGPTAASCAPPFSFPTVTRPVACGFDYVPFVDNISESAKTNLVGRVSWQVHPDNLVFAEGSYYRGDFAYKISPTPVVPRDPFANPFQLLPSSPFYPAAFVASVPRGNTSVPVQIQYRLVELGPRISEPTVDQTRVVAGSQGVIGEWDYVASVGHTRNRQEDRYGGGWVSAAGFRELLDAGRVNPFAPNTPETMELLRGIQITGPVSDNRASHTAAELKATSSPWELVHGPLSVALGVEGRREKLEQSSADVLYTGDVLGGSGPTPSLEPATRRVGSVFAEASAPLARDLEANLAVRHDRYSDFGGTTNPRLSIRWQAGRSLVLRGSAGSGFRAPTLYDLFVPNVLSPGGPGDGFLGEDDPIRCPVTGSEVDCDRVFPVKSGGNPGLQPEKSRQANVGFVAEPLPGFALTMDYYRVRIEDLITIVPGFVILPEYEQWGPTHVFRFPPDPATPGLPGPIDYLLGTPVNAGARSTSGIDIDARWRLPGSSWGRFTAAIAGTYVLDYEASEFEDVRPGYANLVTGTGAIARWRHYASLDWSLGAWGATLAQTFQLGHKEHDPLTLNPATGAYSGFRRVGSYSVVDFQARYTGWRNLVASAGIRNLMDRDPPSAYGPNTFQRGYDPSYADPRGRMFYVAFTYAFR